MDYKQKIKNRWPTGKELTDWLDRNYKDWRGISPDIVADYILFEVLGHAGHGEMAVEEAQHAEDWIMEEYLGA